MTDPFEALARTSDDRERLRVLEAHPDLRSETGFRKLLTRLESGEDPAAGGCVPDAALGLARLLDPEDRAEALSAVAHLLFRRARYAEAASLYAEAADQAVPGSPVEVEARLRGIDCSGARGDLDGGLALAAELEARLGSTDSPDANLALLWSARGHLLLSASRFAEALASYDAAARVHAELGDEQRLAEVELRQATALMRLGRFREAEPVFRRGKGWFLATSERTPRNETFVAIAASSLGVLSYYLGRYGDALSEYEDARARFTRSGSEAQRAMVCDNIAETCLELNLLAESGSLAAEAAAIFDRLNLPGHRARADINRARAFLRGRPPRRAEAVRLLREARRTLLLSGDHVWTMLAGLELALALIPEDPREALKIARAAEQFCDENRLDHHATYARWALAEAALASGDDAAAAAAFADLLVRAEALNLSDLAARVRLRRGELAERGGDRAAARAEFDQALEWIERTRASLGAEDYRASFLEDKEVVFRKSVELALDASGGVEPAEVLRRVERGKSRILLDYLAALEEGRNTGSRNVLTDTAPGGAPVSPAARVLSERRLAVREELRVLYRRRRDPAPEVHGSPASPPHPMPGAEPAPRDPVPHLEAEYLDLTRRLQSLFPGRGVTEVAVDLADRLAARLDPDTALLNLYELGPDLLHITLYRGSPRVERLPGAADRARALLADFEDDVLGDMVGLDVTEAGDSLGAALARRAEKILVALYHTILAPVEEHFARASRLAIVPHGALHLAPFAALISPRGTLVDLYEPTLLPSASALIAPRRRRAAGRPVVIGGPSGRLSEVETELREVTAQLGARLVDGSGPGVRDALRDAPAIHFAGHAVLRRDNPLLSWLELPDGRLTLGDVLELDLAADLVTLAGCDTAAGASRPGDELLGMARAFLHAGAGALIGTLWPVEDRASRDLISRFYAHLAMQPPARALRMAQLDVRKVRPHPYYWAGFVHVGAPRRFEGSVA